MEKLLSYYLKIEKFFGQLKFAVVIILLFSAYLTFGTFMESYHGTDYANRLVYKSLPFMFIQLMMFVSILCATLQRLPYRKPLAGFYVLHLGLLLLFIGSFITYIHGVDGNLTLYPNTPNREVLLNEDVLKIQLINQKKEVKFNLPYTYSEKKLEGNYQGVKLLSFLPFADNNLDWIKQKEEEDSSRLHSSRYLIENEMVQEEFTLSLHPEAQDDFKNSTTMGPLSVHYMPQILSNCFSSESKHGYIVWDPSLGKCTSPLDSELKLTTTSKGLKKLSFIYQSQLIHFIPDVSPLPVTKDLKNDEESPLRLFNRKLFEEKPHLFLFGTALAYFSKDENRWHLEKIDKNSGSIDLPWMNFKLSLLDHYTRYYPKMIPKPVTPIQDNNSLITGQIRAVLCEVEGERFWIKRGEPFTYKGRDEEYTFILGTSSLVLPFEITLKKFKMDNDPGTRNPASYESFVSLFNGLTKASDHHVFMNNPLKEKQYTFYQASYFEAAQDVYGSVLSVNYDPGRFLKYLGSLFLVLGSFWHFVIRRRKETKNV
jgi:hypothetical protein